MSCLSQLSISVDILSYEDEARKGSVLVMPGCSSCCLDNLLCLYLLSFLRTLLVSWATPFHSLLILFATLSLSSADAFKLIPEHWPGISVSLPQLLLLDTSF